MLSSGPLASSTSLDRSPKLFAVVAEVLLLDPKSPDIVMAPDLISEEINDNKGGCVRVLTTDLKGYDSPQNERSSAPRTS